VRENQETIENSATFQTLEAEQEAGREDTQPMDIPKPKRDFIRWYDTYTAIGIEDGTTPDSEAVGSSMLQCLYANMAPASADSVIEIPPTLQEIASSHSPWQVVEAIPYVMQQLCMVYRRKNWVAPNELVAGIHNMIEILPYIYLPVISWCAKEILTPLPSMMTA